MRSSRWYERKFTPAFWCEFGTATACASILTRKSSNWWLSLSFVALSQCTFCRHPQQPTNLWKHNKMRSEMLPWIFSAVYTRPQKLTPKMAKRRRARNRSAGKFPSIWVRSRGLYLKHQMHGRTVWLQISWALTIQTRVNASVGLSSEQI